MTSFAAGGRGWGVSVRGCRSAARGANAAKPRGCLAPADVIGPCTVEAGGDFAGGSASSGGEGAAGAAVGVLGWDSCVAPTGSEGIGGGVFRLGRKSAALGTCAIKPRGLLAMGGACGAAGEGEPRGTCTDGLADTRAGCIAAPGSLRSSCVSGGAGSALNIAESPTSGGGWAEACSDSASSRPPWAREP